MEAISFRLAPFSNCSKSSFIVVLLLVPLDGQDEVLVGNRPEHHALEAVEVEEAVLLGLPDRGDEWAARVFAQELEQAPESERAPSRCPPLQARNVARERRFSP